MVNTLQPRRSRVQSNTAAAIAGADTADAIRCPLAGTIAGVSYVPEALITGAATNSRTLQVVNKGQDGAGVAVVATLALVAGVNAPAFDETSLTLSATPANLVVLEGDVLSLQSNHVGTGIADPGGDFIVTIQA